MTVDIIVKEKTGSREIRFPVLPEKISAKYGNATFISYDIVNRGEVAVPSGTDLSVYSWESIFPGKLIKDAYPIRGTWQEPKTYNNILEDWKKNGTKLTLMVTGYPINTDVYVESYTAEGTGAFGDIEYEISFIEVRDITIKTTKVSTASSSSATTTTTKRPATKSSKYTIKQGDTLWSIARKFYGKGTKWKTIYNANKDIIESTAKKRWKAAGINRDSENGHWIFPGVTLTIPL